MQMALPQPPDFLDIGHQKGGQTYRELNSILASNRDALRAEARQMKKELRRNDVGIARLKHRKAQREDNLLAMLRSFDGFNGLNGYNGLDGFGGYDPYLYDHYYDDDDDEDDEDDDDDDFDDEDEFFQ
ncbi:MAG: hypothetical protein KVP17_005060 [Porospora cf. gigantea B]|uniref:uncharacterized protein n=1 Tax=Porospora cf. gigantea B TaxID=2853592 RepID=UPI003571B217|nr:MAG: hypothetical protein KVP17_005060 [Porospora cf. gigantea B]